MDALVDKCCEITTNVMNCVSKKSGIKGGVEINLIMELTDIAIQRSIHRQYIETRKPFDEIFGCHSGFENIIGDYVIGVSARSLEAFNLIVTTGGADDAALRLCLCTYVFPRMTKLFVNMDLVNLRRKVNSLDYAKYFLKDLMPKVASLA